MQGSTPKNSDAQTITFVFIITSGQRECRYFAATAILSTSRREELRKSQRAAVLQRRLFGRNCYT
jgi:hypothetical protein